MTQRRVVDPDSDNPALDNADSHDAAPGHGDLESDGVGVELDEQTRGLLADYLASAPKALRPWARHQAASLGLELEDKDEPPRPAATPARPGRARKLSPSTLMLIAVLAAVLVYGVYQFGDRSQSVAQPTSLGTPSAAPPVDQAKAAELKAKVAANPADAEAIRALGELYHAAGDDAAALPWRQQSVDLRPADVDARLSLGVAQFNTDDLPGAEKSWLKAVALDPTSAQAHFNLGFLYLGNTPPDLTKVQEHWAKVIELEPTSELASIVSAHLQRLNSASPSPSPSATR
ncbi:MAG: tetratricopeptide repeat protein [Propionicimonas sp.]